MTLHGIDCIQSLRHSTDISLSSPFFLSLPFLPPNFFPLSFLTCAPPPPLLPHPPSLSPWLPGFRLFLFVCLFWWPMWSQDLCYCFASFFFFSVNTTPLWTSLLLSSPSADTQSKDQTGRVTCPNSHGSSVRIREHAWCDAPPHHHALHTQPCKDPIWGLSCSCPSSEQVPDPAGYGSLQHKCGHVHPLLNSSQSTNPWTDIQSPTAAASWFWSLWRHQGTMGITWALEPRFLDMWSWQMIFLSSMCLFIQ